MEITIIRTTLLCLIIILGNIRKADSQGHLPEKQAVIDTENVLLQENTSKDQNTHSRVKRQFGLFPPYDPRPLPIIVGIGGIGFGGFGGGFGRGFGRFGGRGFGGFGGRGFGGRGFGGRGFGGRGFGGRGFGGRGFGGRGIGGRGGFGGRGRG